MPRHTIIVYQRYKEIIKAARQEQIFMYKGNSGRLWGYFPHRNYRSAGSDMISTKFWMNEPSNIIYVDKVSLRFGEE